MGYSYFGRNWISGLSDHRMTTVSLPLLLTRSLLGEQSIYPSGGSRILLGSRQRSQPLRPKMSEKLVQNV